jgi:GT2 family glycosyltransferase
MTVSIIIPNYNGAHLLKKNLPKVFAAATAYTQDTGSDIEVVVSDDGSGDGSIGLLYEEQEKRRKEKVPLVVIERKQNTGFSPAVNRGVKEAQGDILVLLNSDVSPEREFLKPLLRHFSDEKVFAVGCLDRSPEGEREVLRGRGVGTWQRGFLIHRAGKVESDKTLWASGGSSAFRKRLWVKLGGLYEIYRPFYWEDIDLSYRAQKAGYHVVFEPQSRVVHEHEAGSIKQQFTRKKITLVAYRNQFLFVWLNITQPSLLLSHTLWLPVHILRAIMRLDGRFLSGFFAALLRLPAVMSLRRKNSALFTVNDTTVIAASQ